MQSILLGCIFTRSNRINKPKHEPAKRNIVRITEYRYCDKAGVMTIKSKSIGDAPQTDPCFQSALLHVDENHCIESLFSLHHKYLVMPDHILGGLATVN